MKTFFTIVTFVVCLVSASPVDWTEDFRRIEAEQVALWKQRLNEARAVEPGNRPALLWLGLRNMGHRNTMNGCSPAVQRIYREIQRELLSIPGHAQYFANEIKGEQKLVAKYPTSTGPRVGYDFNRAMYFNTLAHLPSPETISVLGDFLSDDIDTPRERISPHSDWGENPRANSFASSFTLSTIGLRDAPVDMKEYDASPEAHLAKTRAWWEEIKSGMRTFSFKGQAVEYRFKPDGTWDTIAIANPPDDGHQMVAAAVPARPKVDSGPLASASGHEQKGFWVWIVIGLIGGLALVFWLGVRRFA
jgi:hypothetical protein